MKVLVLGAGGIIGQHLRCTVPSGLDVVFTRTVAGGTVVPVDLTDHRERTALLNMVAPDVIVNLAGEARPDVVEQAPERFRAINTEVPRYLCEWSKSRGSYLLHVSTQGVFSGKEPPYGPQSPRNPVNQYGKQKRDAEDIVLETPYFHTWCIARPTFVLGARPDTRVGRSNPLEDMLLSPKQRQVTNRWFSVSFAHDVARCLWKLVHTRPERHIVHLGHAGSFTRFELSYAIIEAAGIAGTDIIPVCHEAFIGLAPRPIDTTYDGSAWHLGGFTENLELAIKMWRAQTTGLRDGRGQYAGP